MSLVVLVSSMLLLQVLLILPLLLLLLLVLLLFIPLLMLLLPLLLLLVLLMLLLLVISVAVNIGIAIVTERPGGVRVTAEAALGVELAEGPLRLTHRADPLGGRGVEAAVCNRLHVGCAQVADVESVVTELANRRFGHALQLSHG